MKSSVKSLVLCTVMLSATQSFAHTSSDSTTGTLIKRVIAKAQFFSFSKQDSNAAYLNLGDAAMTAFTLQPAMDCFLANHMKDDLQVSYEIWEREREGKTVRVNNATRIVSLKTGDDTKNWAQKESGDAEMMKDHHEKLKEVRAGYLR